ARQPLPAARLRGGMRPWAARSSLRRAASTTSGPGGGSASSRWTPLSSSMGLLLPAPGGAHGVRRAVAVYPVGAAARLSPPRPCPAQPRAHGAIGNAKRQGALLVVQASDGHQQQHVPVAAAQPGQRGGQGRPGSRGTDSLSDQVLITGCYSLGVCPRQRAVAALLLAPVCAGQVGGDAIQPRPGTLAGQAITLALGKRDGDPLRRQIIGDPPPGPRRQVPVNLAEIAAEDLLEPFRLGP